MNKKVLLTGISGYIGNHCAVELLKNGYSVRGSLRSLSKSGKVIAVIKKEVDPKDNLEFCELDLLSNEGWDDAMKGCEFLLHVASPFIILEPKDENEYIRPAVDGTIRALKAAKKAGIKRVVLTSSMVSMLEDADKSIEINFESWSNVNAKNVGAYAKSKTLAEQAAWDFIRAQTDAKPMELSVVNPGPVYGSRSATASSNVIDPRFISAVMYVYEASKSTSLRIAVRRYPKRWVSLKTKACSPSNSSSSSNSSRRRKQNADTSSPWPRRKLVSFISRIAPFAWPENTKASRSAKYALLPSNLGAFLKCE